MGFLDKAKQAAQDAQRKLDESGALDKAKQAAQQAQQRIEEKQRDLNRERAGSAGADRAPGDSPTRYDEHGRPIEPEGPPAGTARPPSTEPVSAPPSDDPAAAPTQAPEPAAAGPAPPAEEEAPSPEQAPPAEEGEKPNRTPDPFRPIQ